MIAPYERGIASPSDLAMPTAPIRVTPIATMKPTEPFMTARIMMYASEPSKVIRLAIITAPLRRTYFSFVMRPPPYSLLLVSFVLYIVLHNLHACS